MELFSLIIQERTSPTHRSKKWNYFDIVRYVYSFKSPDLNIWIPFFKEHNDENYFFSHFFHIILSLMVYLTTFLIRKDGDFIFRFLKIVSKKRQWQHIQKMKSFIELWTLSRGKDFWNIWVPFLLKAKIMSKMSLEICFL